MLEMSEITPLHRTVRDGSKLKRVGGVWGELLAEFLDTFVVICFDGGAVALAVAARPGTGC